VDADGEIRRSDGPGGEARGRTTRELAIRLGHEGGARLVAGRDHVDAGRLEPLEQAEEALAGHGEGVSHAGESQ
jgi:hypothetical protein